MPWNVCVRLLVAGLRGLRGPVHILHLREHEWGCLHRHAHAVSICLGRESVILLLSHCQKLVKAPAFWRNIHLQNLRDTQLRKVHDRRGEMGKSNRKWRGERGVVCIVNGRRLLLRARWHRHILLRLR